MRSWGAHMTGVGQLGKTGRWERKLAMTTVLPVFLGSGALLSVLVCRSAVEVRIRDPVVQLRFGGVLDDVTR